MYSRNVFSKLHIRN